MPKSHLTYADALPQEEALDATPPSFEGSGLRLSPTGQIRTRERGGLTAQTPAGSTLASREGWHDQAHVADRLVLMHLDVSFSVNKSIHCLGWSASPNAQVMGTRKPGRVPDWRRGDS